MKTIISILIMLFSIFFMTAQLTYDEVTDPNKKMRGKYKSYTAYNGVTYKSGDLLVLQYANSNSTYMTIFSPGMLLTMISERPNEVVRIEEFKAQHTMGIGLLYAIVRGDNNKKYQIAIDAALQTKEIKEYNKGVTVDSLYDDMEETTSFQTSSLTIAYNNMPYVDFDIRKLSSGKYYLRAYYRSKYRLDGCFRKNDAMKIKTDKHGVIELANIMDTECGDSGVLAYEVPENILIKLAESNWQLMRLYHNEPYLEYKPDGNSDYFSQLAVAILEY